MRLELIPDREIAAILAQACTGPYRFVQHALVPYVRIGPATDEEPMTVTPGPALQLKGNGPRTLQGVDARLEFAVWFRPNLVLVEIACLPRRRQAMAQKALQALAEEWR